MYVYGFGDKLGDVLDLSPSETMHQRKEVGYVVVSIPLKPYLEGFCWGISNTYHGVLLTHSYHKPYTCMHVFTLFFDVVQAIEMCRNFGC